MIPAPRGLRAFIDIAPESHFSIHNLPYGVFRRGKDDPARVGVALGDFVLDLAALQAAGLLRHDSLPSGIFARGSLNAFMTLGRPAWGAARALLQNLLSAANPTLRDDADLRARALWPLREVELLLPVEIGDYTDFYSSEEHATNVGIMFRGKEQALMPNWKHLPVAYHGRASSVVLSGTPVHRPQGQIKADDAPAPEFAPSRQLDFELEMGFFIGPGSALGQPIPVTRAAEHIFGLVLVNDWSARDIQRWEYQPLGPFLSKNFATSISPWVVTLDALEPFRTAGPRQEPPPLPYLQSQGDQAYDIHLEALLQTAQQSAPLRIARTNFRHLYWNMHQQLAHHTITGCNLRPGDLLASGTISGPTADSYGSLLELTWRGTKPITLPSGETRAFLEDGDTLTLTGWCQGEGYRVGFGAVSGQILPAVKQD